MSKSRCVLTLVFAAISFFVSLVTYGQDSAPSSHMVFDDSFDGDIIINQVRVPKSGDTLYTYYEALGWRGRAAGYAGIQSHPKAKNFIFSIWDHKDHKGPIKAVYYGPGTKTLGFGGEGTGLKSWNFDLGWKTDVWYTLVSRCWPVGDHTHFGFWTMAGDSKEWTHLVTMDVATKEARFRGRTDAFIEDWLSTGKSKRETQLRLGWKRKMDGTWFPFQEARYSVNYWDLEEGKRSYNFRTNWNGGVQKDRGQKYYFMKAGGASTKPTTTNPSNHKIARSEKKPQFNQLKLKALNAKISGDFVELDWTIDPKSSPQFRYVIAIKDRDNKSIKSAKVIDKMAPHVRKTTFSRGASKNIEIYFYCIDIFGRKSETRTVVPK